MASPKFSKTHTLVDPIKREGIDPIADVKLRKPSTGDLRGLSLIKVQLQDVDTMTNVIGRLCEPRLTPEEVADLDVIDFTELSGLVVGFLFTQEQIEQASL